MSEGRTADTQFRKATTEKAIAFNLLLAEAEEQYDRYLNELDDESDDDVAGFYLTIVRREANEKRCWTL